MAIGTERRSLRGFVRIKEKNSKMVKYFPDLNGAYMLSGIRHLALLTAELLIGVHVTREKMHANAFYKTR